MGVGWNSLRKYRESSGKIGAWEIQNIPFRIKNRILNCADLITKKGAHLFFGGGAWGVALDFRGSIYHVCMYYFKPFPE